MELICCGVPGPFFNVSACSNEKGAQYEVSGVREYPKPKSVAWGLSVTSSVCVWPISGGVIPSGQM
jgi:hypothetical protein